MTNYCNICLQPAERPAKRMNYDQLVECCICSCHDEHVGSFSSHAIFVRRARKSGLKGSGIGYGADKCGQGGVMTTEHNLRDGSKCVVDDDGRMATISRFVDGKRVWGQVFTGSRDDHEQLVASVVADMRLTPSAFTRRDLWDENGRAVK